MSRRIAHAVLVLIATVAGPEPPCALEDVARGAEAPRVVFRASARVQEKLRTLGPRVVFMNIRRELVVEFYWAEPVPGVEVDMELLCTVALGAEDYSSLRVPSKYGANDGWIKPDLEQRFKTIADEHLERTGRAGSGPVDYIVWLPLKIERPLTDQGAVTV